MAGGNTVPMPRRDSRSRQTAGNKKRRRFFNLTTGFDMHFFVLLMIILVIGLATL